LVGIIAGLSVTNPAPPGPQTIVLSRVQADGSTGAASPSAYGFGLGLVGTLPPSTSTVVATVTDSEFDGNPASGLFVEHRVSLTLRRDTIAGNNTAEGLDNALPNDFGGITASGAVLSLDASPAGPGQYNHITGNGVGVVIEPYVDNTTTPPTYTESKVTGNLVGNDITGNLQAGIEVLGAPDLSGLTVTGNSIYGSSFGNVPAALPLTLPAQPARGTPYPYYGYVNFGTGQGMNLAGNWFGISTPSTVTAPSATPAVYTDIRGATIGSSPVIQLAGSVLGPTVHAHPGQNVALQVQATLNDGQGHTVQDGTPVEFFAQTGIGAATPLGQATTVGGVAGGTFTYNVPSFSHPQHVSIQVLATAPDRAETVATGGIPVRGVS
jgi:hypothetical protein